MNKKLKFIMIFGVAAIFLGSILGIGSGKLFSQRISREKLKKKTYAGRKNARVPVYVTGHLVVNLSANVINIQIGLKQNKPGGAPISDATVSLDDSLIPAQGNGLYKGAITHFVSKEDNDSRKIFIKIAQKNGNRITVSAKIDFLLELDVSPLYDKDGQKVFAVDDTLTIRWNITPGGGIRRPVHLRLINRDTDEIMEERKELYDKKVEFPPKRFRRKKRIKILANVRHDELPITGNVHPDSFVKVKLSTSVHVKAN